ncbi:MAG: HU family DNA-binding protein [Candidatus Phytoplasma asteris]|uniref:Bacterial nucleoid DNA-binding protein n=2 Tax=16SrI (Aster yellows group) TaxID=3042590 RepID=Q6YPM7_ONYPE|nr:HU family DNA-binding protein ['Chrysanthemum coronarium' phytoplasma]TKA87866.1 MAG: DNA-binding protein HU [Periwinkle leaf yellowing phytoplasma]WEX19659.1 MAG: HU family DNA-binding protein [Candidatus Phytoplasma asteris]BAD04619.1 bacterial nucleoid DNA-binding protein [Onion yellows phytoplasma OY-M]BAD04783.1 bacterial nucleoid DNA-binding protein [Onion yellows phytoplasma OY-M]GAK74332.1 bacterial nucleoid DNA-binding protein ['Chrysanthemum coronarium' phytoplasma]
MTKKELIKSIAEKNKTSITQTEEFYNSFENAIIKAITNNAEVVLSSKLGKFILKTRKAHLTPETKFIINKRTGKKNAQRTGKNLKIPSKTVVTFKLSKTIKDKVKELKLK